MLTDDDVRTLVRQYRDAVATRIEAEQKLNAAKAVLDAAQAEYDAALTTEGQAGGQMTQAVQAQTSTA